MRWEAWTLLIETVVEVLVIVSHIGKLRPVVTPGAAIFTMFWAAGEAWLILRLAGVA